MYGMAMFICSSWCNLSSSLSHQYWLTFSVFSSPNVLWFLVSFCCTSLILHAAASVNIIWKCCIVRCMIFDGLSVISEPCRVQWILTSNKWKIVVSKINKSLIQPNLRICAWSVSSCSKAPPPHPIIQCVVPYNIATSAATFAKKILTVLSGFLWLEE